MAEERLAVIWGVGCSLGPAVAGGEKQDVEDNVAVLGVEELVDKGGGVLWFW
jgi:hypothetical protein